MFDVEGNVLFAAAYGGHDNYAPFLSIQKSLKQQYYYAHVQWDADIPVLGTLLYCQSSARDIGGVRWARVL
jgi:hypothetical protein